MAESVAQVEFSIPETFQANRSGPIRWILSHAVHHWPVLVVALLGALGNAGFFIP